MPRNNCYKQAPQDMSHSDSALAEFISTSNASYFILVYIIVLIYCCFGLAIVCDVYFVPAIQKLSRTFNLPPDIAGSTLMALGASVPELFASLIGVFVTQDDIGTGSIIGSSCFNLVAVPAACAFMASTTFQGRLKLNPFPVLRNLAYYVITILVLLLIIKDKYVDIPEALILLLFFFMYLALMVFSAISHKNKLQDHRANLSLDDYTTETCISRDSALSGSESCLTNNHLYDIQAPSYLLVNSTSEHNNFSKSHLGLMNSTVFPYPNPNYHDLQEPTSDYMKRYQSATEKTPLVEAYCNSQFDGSYRPLQNRHSVPPDYPNLQKFMSRPNLDGRLGSNNMGLALKNSTCLTRSRAAGLDGVEITLPQHYNDEIGKQTEQTEWVSSKWILIPMLPLTLSMKVLSPCKFRSTFWTIWTFLVSICAIGALTYVAVWMVHCCSDIIGLPDTVAGMTILSMGTGITEIIASLVLIKKIGQADMAICNTIGSNVIDVSFCLSVPWLIRAFSNFLDDRRPIVSIKSQALPWTTLLLLVAALLLVLVFKVNKWMLNFRVGVWLSLVYISFVVSSTYLEANYGRSGIDLLRLIR